MFEKILLTGFGPFGSHEVNVTQQAVERLDGVEREGFQLKALTLPVQFERAVSLLEEALETERPVAVIMSGVHSDEPTATFRLEVAARNERHYSIPDVDGHLVQGATVEPEGPPMVFGTLPVGAIKQRLEAEGIAVQLSEDAGRFLCNAAYYWTARRVPLSGFLHVPPALEGVDEATRALDLAATETARRLAAQRVEATTA